ncbi:hypothetical protein [Candidatus Burkholderia verschuerenii]|uniref:hypothetical protein n=1 Tax=Candidatus Burkholderia verschuerenii TaxID=242163 RepID=UPI00067E1624|nr:hypothetical protein [Candidatus Burkholderia verschuerenii]
MNSKLIGVAFVVALAAASYALAAGYGPAQYYDAEGSPPVAADDTPKPAPDDVSVAKDKQNSPLIQAQD